MLKFLQESHSRSRGFTLIEMLLVVAAIALIAGIGIPVYQTFQVGNDLELATHVFSQGARRAQALSQAAEGDVSWGVHATSGAIVVFQGTSYASRTVANDEFFSLSDSVTPSGLGEVTFDVFTGSPSATGTVVFTAKTGVVRNITINEKGSIQY